MLKRLGYALGSAALALAGMAAAIGMMYLLEGASGWLAGLCSSLLGSWYWLLLVALTVGLITRSVAAAGWTVLVVALFCLLGLAGGWVFFLLRWGMVAATPIAMVAAGVCAWKEDGSGKLSNHAGSRDRRNRVVTRREKGQSYVVIDVTSRPVD